MQKIAIYTCITGGFDSLEQPEVLDDRFDYICFTAPENAAAGRDGAWILKPVESPQDLPDRLLSRKPKLLPHEFLKEYDCSVWMDGNMRITDALFYDLVLNCLESPCPFYAMKHPLRDCIYDEILACVSAKKCSFRAAGRTLDYLEKEKWPRHAGLMENGILIRRHNEPAVVATDSLWWDSVSGLVPRDQFTLLPCAARNGLEIKSFLPEGMLIRSCKLVRYTVHDRVPGQGFPKKQFRELSKRISLMLLRRRIAGIF